VGSLNESKKSKKSKNFKKVKTKSKKSQKKVKNLNKKRKNSEIIRTNLQERGRGVWQLKYGCRSVIGPKVFCMGAEEYEEGE